MPFNVLRNAIIRNDMQCRHDNNDGFAVVWNENDNFKQYTEFSGLITRLVWDRNYVSASISGSCFLGPNTDQAPFDGSIYHLIKVNYRLETSFGQQKPTVGRIQFQTDDDPIYDGNKTVDFTVIPDNAYREYSIDMSRVKAWQGNITRIRLYPFVDGAAGIIIHLKSLKVKTTTVFTCDTSFNGELCSRFSQYERPCPWVGSGGSCESILVDDGIDIVENVNNKLIVNINNYGDQAITLTPVRKARLSDVARDIEDKLSNVAIGGYAGVKAEVNLGKLSIISDDTREAISTVVVKDTAASRTLGFFDSLGNDTSICKGGEDAASRYEPAGTRQLSKAEISHLYLSEPDSDFSGIDFDVNRFATQAGRADFATTYKDKKIDFSGKTIIDFNNPVSNNGVITTVSYSGDGGTNTEFRFFRPRLDGSIVHIASIDMEITGNAIDKFFEHSSEVRVRKGDFVGIFDGKLDAGKTEEFPNNSYFLFEGDLKDGKSTPILPVKGRGETGLRLFAHGADLEDEAVIDIKFEQPELIEEITAFAEEVPRVEEINLSRGQSGGIGGGPIIEGEVGVDKFGDPAPALTNLGAITDKTKHNVVSAPTLHPSWLDTSFEPADKFDQTEFAVNMDFAKGIPVLFNINKVRLYFRDTNNIKYFSIRYPITTDDADTIRLWGPVADTYNQVLIEDKLLGPNDHPLYQNPIRPTAATFTDSYQFLAYRVLDFQFNAVRARSIRYEVKNFFFEDDPTKTTLSNYTLAPSPHILEIEVFAESTPVADIQDNFFFQTSNDGLNFVLHNRSSSVGSTSASYLIGYPVRYIKAHILPQGKMKFRSFSTTTTRAKARIKTNAGGEDVALNFSQKDFISTETIRVTNTFDEPFNYFIDISPQKNPVERCILWNKMGSDSELQTSELGPGGTVLKRDNYFPREYNYSLNVPGYVIDPLWLLNINAKAYISYDLGNTWSARGNILTDYNINTSLTATNPDGSEALFTYIILDLGDVYGLETVQVIDPAFGAEFSGPQYSNKNTSDPDDMDVIADFTGVKEEARWLRFNAFQRSPGDPEESAEISYVILSLDILRGTNKGKFTWVPAPKLTNYKFGSSIANSCGEGWMCSTTGFTNWYAVDLEEIYNITNILVGPTDDGITTRKDIDTSTPGSAASAFSSSSKVNGGIAYSSSLTSDPSKVNWGPLGKAPSSRERWVLFKRSGGIRDEVVVHIEDNIQKNKPPFANFRWWTSVLGTIVKDKQNFREGTYSLSIDYAANQGPNKEILELEQSLGIDSVLARRDSLRILLYVSDASQLDTTAGSFSIGRNTTESNKGREPLKDVVKDVDNYYKWNFSDIPTISSGWNEFFLPFSDNFKVGEPYFVRDNHLSFAAGDTTSRSRFRWFKVEFSGNPGNKLFTVNLDGIRIERGKYLPAKWNKGLYLAGEEYVKFPLHNFNPLKGTIEFWLNPDWSKAPGCFACEDIKDHTIFRFFNSDKYVFAAFMTGLGLRIYLSNGERHYYLTDNSNQPIKIGETTHVAVVWDLLGEEGEQACTVYINNKFSSAFAVEALQTPPIGIKPNPNVVLMLGGLGWDGAINRLASSVEGVIDNLRVYNYIIRDFSHSINNEGLEYVRPSDELIEISVDNSTFVGSKDRGSGLPIAVRNVPAGTSFDIYVKNKDNEVSEYDDGQDRNSYIEVIRARPG